MSGGVRLDKLVANLGYGSRRDVQALARAGQHQPRRCTRSKMRSTR